MKKTVLGIFASVFVLAILGSCGGSGNNLFSSKDPGDYHDDIVYDYTELDNTLAEFSTGIWDSTVTLEDLQDMYDRCQEIIDHNFQNLKDTKTLKDDPGLLQSVIDFYQVADDALNNEYEEVMSYYEKDTWEDSYSDKIYDLDNAATDKIIKKEDNVIDEQKKFADAYGFDLY